MLEFRLYCDDDDDDYPYADEEDSFKDGKESKNPGKLKTGREYKRDNHKGWTR